MLRSVLRFAGWLVGLLVVAMVLGGGIVGWRIGEWKASKARELLAPARQLALGLADLDVAALEAAARARSGRGPAPQACDKASQCLDQLCATTWPGKGPSLALLSLQHGVRGPWLATLASSGNAYPQVEGLGVEPAGPASAVARALERGEDTTQVRAGENQDETPQVSAYAWVRDAAGRKVAVLAVDRDQVLGEADLRAVAVAALPWLLVLLLGLVGALAWYFADTFVDPLETIRLLYQVQQAGYAAALPQPGSHQQAAASPVVAPRSQHDGLALPAQAVPAQPASASSQPAGPVPVAAAREGEAPIAVEPLALEAPTPLEPTTPAAEQAHPAQGAAHEAERVADQVAVPIPAVAAGAVVAAAPESPDLAAPLDAPPVVRLEPRVPLRVDLHTPPPEVRDYKRPLPEREPIDKFVREPESVLATKHVAELPARKAWELFTPAEKKVVAHAVEGISNGEIGKRMYVTPGTVKKHFTSIYSKFSQLHVFVQADTHDKRAAVVLAMQVAIDSRELDEARKRD